MGLRSRVRRLEDSILRLESAAREQGTIELPVVDTCGNYVRETVKSPSYSFPDYRVTKRKSVRIEEVLKVIAEMGSFELVVEQNEDKVALYDREET